MKNFVLLFLGSVFSFISCQQEHTNESNKNISATVQFLNPGPCCSNMELINQESVFSDLVGYSETILAAVNMDDFSDLGINNNDFLEIQYNFSSDEFLPCNFTCNRQNGIPIKVISIQKL